MPTHPRRAPPPDAAAIMSATRRSRSQSSTRFERLTMARRRKSDAALLRASRTDPEAFGVFYARHLPLVLGFLVSRSNDRKLAADLAAEVFAAALEGRD